MRRDTNKEAACFIALSLSLAVHRADGPKTKLKYHYFKKKEKKRFYASTTTHRYYAPICAAVCMPSKTQQQGKNRGYRQFY